MRTLHAYMDTWWYMNFTWASRHTYRHAYKYTYLFHVPFSYSFSARIHPDGPTETALSPRQVRSDFLEQDASLATPDILELFAAWPCRVSLKIWRKPLEYSADYIIHLISREFSLPESSLISLIIFIHISHLFSDTRFAVCSNLHPWKLRITKQTQTCSRLSLDTAGTFAMFDITELFLRQPQPDPPWLGDPISTGQWGKTAKPIMN